MRSSDSAIPTGKSLINETKRIVPPVRPVGKSRLLLPTQHLPLKFYSLGRIGVSYGVQPHRSEAIFAGEGGRRDRCARLHPQIKRIRLQWDDEAASWNYPRAAGVAL